MKTILIMGLLTISSTVFSAVVKSYDVENRCDLYRVINETSKEKQKNETIVTTKSVYGLGINDLDIDFEAHEAKVNVVMNIVMGFNLPLVEGKTSIDEKNSQIKMLTNQLNRKLSLLENICITKDNRIIYGKVMEAN
jgi:biopolymer transport protein ExbD